MPKNTNRRTNLQIMIDESMESGNDSFSFMRQNRRTFKHRQNDTHTDNDRWINGIWHCWLLKYETVFGRMFLWVPKDFFDFPRELYSLSFHIWVSLAHFTFWCHMLITHADIWVSLAHLWYHLLITLPCFTRPFHFLVSFADYTSGCHLPIYGVICWLHIWVSPAHLTSWYHSLITHLGVTRPLCLRVIFTDCIPMCCASGWYSWFANMNITCQIHYSLICW